MKLNHWMKQNGVKSQDIAEWTGQTVRTVDRWRSGQSVPRRSAMSEISKRTHGAVSPSDWFLIESTGGGVADQT